MTVVIRSPDHYVRLAGASDVRRSKKSQVKCTKELPKLLPEHERAIFQSGKASACDKDEQ